MNKTPLNKNETGKILYLLFLVVLITPSEVFAQNGKVDFSGEWIINETKSNLGDFGGRGASQALAITHSGIHLTIERTGIGRDGQETINVEKLTLDGKQCENTTNNRTRKSTATWSDDGKALTINSVMAFNRQGQTMEMKSKEVWTLKDGGKTLTIDSSSSTPRGERKTALVYDKKEQS